MQEDNLNSSTLTPEVKKKNLLEFCIICTKIKKFFLSIFTIQQKKDNK